MNRTVYRFTFSSRADLAEAEATLHLALLAAEGLFGRARVRLDVRYDVDERRRLIVVDGATEIGAVVTRMFTGLLLREFGDDAFRTHRAERAREDRTRQGVA